MKTRFIFLLGLLLSNHVLSQGSGYSVNLDGTNDYVKISGADADNYAITPTFTMEAWVKPSSLSSTNTSCITAFSSWSLASLDRGIVFGLKSTGMYFHIWNGSMGIFRNYTIAATISTTEYSHVAITKSGSNLNFYLNGVLLSTQTNCNNYTSTSNLNATIGAERYNASSSKFFNGDIDEVRIWNYAKTMTELKDGMCKKITPLTAGLLTYYRFDESTGATTSDQGSVGANGTLTNLTMAGTTSNRISSKAPIGDVSTYLYTSSWTGQSVSLSSASNGDFEVNTVAGVPNGVHVYRVDDFPNSTSGINVPLTTGNAYFGTFVVNGTTPTYTAVYDYSTYAEAMSDQFLIALYNRANNSILNWSDIGATNDNALNILTKTGVSARGEFIIGENIVVLPLELIDFTAVYNASERNVQLNWTTASEINLEHFTIEKTVDGINYETIGSVNASGTSQENHAYEMFDLQPTAGISYYRLKLINYDGAFVFSDLRTINLENELAVSIYPNPSSIQVLKIQITLKQKEDVEIQFYNEIGQLIIEDQLFSIDKYVYNVTDKFKEYSGILFCRIKTGNQTLTNKIVVL